MYPDADTGALDALACSSERLRSCYLPVPYHPHLSAYSRLFSHQLGFFADAGKAAQVAVPSLARLFEKRRQNGSPVLVDDSFAEHLDTTHRHHSHRELSLPPERLRPDQASVRASIVAVGAGESSHAIDEDLHLCLSPRGSDICKRGGEKSPERTSQRKLNKTCLVLRTIKRETNCSVDSGQLATPERCTGASQTPSNLQRPNASRRKGRDKGKGEEKEDGKRDRSASRDGSSASTRKRPRKTAKKEKKEIKRRIPCPFATRFPARYANLQYKKKECTLYHGMDPGYITEHLSRDHTVKRTCHIKGCQKIFVCHQDKHHDDCQKEFGGSCIEDVDDRRWQEWQKHLLEGDNGRLTHPLDVQMQYPHMMSWEQESKVGCRRDKNKHGNLKSVEKGKWKDLNDRLFPGTAHPPDDLFYFTVNPRFRHQPLDAEQKADIRQFRQAIGWVHEIWSDSDQRFPERSSDNDRARNAMDVDAGIPSDHTFAQRPAGNRKLTAPGTSCQHAAEAPSRPPSSLTRKNVELIQDKIVLVEGLEDNKLFNRLQSATNTEHEAISVQQEPHDRHGTEPNEVDESVDVASYEEEKGTNDGDQGENADVPDNNDSTGDAYHMMDEEMFEPNLGPSLTNELTDNFTDRHGFISDPGFSDFFNFDKFGAENTSSYDPSRSD